ncbi:MAG TPA: hypothetical protein VLL73_02090, partial [Desulfurivibrionaceae bacterium]|nr:hypothetical protein [Desulfurivibrionaceae bacterium]
MTGNARLRTVRALWSALKNFCINRLCPFLKNARLSCACCRKTLKFFFNTPHFPTVVIAISVVATIFANVGPPAPNATSDWASYWQRDATPNECRQAADGAWEINGSLRPGDSLSTSFRR